MKGEGKRLVVLRFSALGDVAMTLPVIYSVAREWPGLEIYVATRPFFARMFVGAPSNVKVIGFDLKDKYRGLKGTFAIARELAALKPDYVADLHNMARTMVISTLLRLRGAKVATVDKARASRHKVYGGGEPQRQYIDRYFDVFARLGLESQPCFTTIFPDGVTLGDDEKNIIKTPAVGIAPFARYATKTYPPQQMRSVAEMLAGRGYNIYLFGGRGAEADILAGWEHPRTESRGEIVSLAGRYPLETELALMSQLSVMVSMDSANQHLAALTGVAVVSIWGGTTPACGFMSYGQSEERCIVLGIECQPCSVAGGDKCPKGHTKCLAIPPQVVVNVVENVIGH